LCLTQRQAGEFGTIQPFLTYIGDVVKVSRSTKVIRPSPDRVSGTIRISAGLTEPSQPIPRQYHRRGSEGQGPLGLIERNGVWGIMRTARWKPLPADVLGAARELAEQLRLLVDEGGLTLRRLAADDDVPYDVTTLRRFLSGRTLPPRRLVEVIADRCDGDREQLLSTLDRAVAAQQAGLPWAAAETAPGPRRRLRDRPAPIVAAFAGLVVAAGAAVAAVRLGDDPPAEADAGAVARSAPVVPPTAAGPVSGRAPAPRSTAARAAPAPAPARRPHRGYQPAPRQTRGNLIRNGTFTGTTMSWWPVSDVRISADGNRLRADVGGGSQESWQRIVSAASFPLRSGRTYVLTFDAAAGGADITDRVTVQADYPPYPKAISRRIELTTSTWRFSYRFTAGFSTERAALNLELGGHPGDHTIWLDNVSLIPA
jgi:hypothetical protein